jgi:hypothetical protein
LLPSLLEAPVTRPRSLLWLLALTCAVMACRAPTTPAKAKSEAAAKAAELLGHAAVLPGASTETGNVSLPPDAPTLTSGLEPADMITATDGAPFGFEDVPWLLDRAGAWLRAHHGGAKEQPKLWQRRDAHGWQTDVMEWRPEGFVLRTQGDDTTLVLSEAGCTVRVANASAKCDPDLRAQATMAAIVTGLAWPEGPGRAAWSVEALHTNRPDRVYVRIALAKLHMRVDLDLRSDGTVQAIRGLGVTLQPDADGVAYSRDDRKAQQTPGGLLLSDAWHWSVQAPGIRDATTHNVLRLDNSAGVDVTIDAWMAAARPRGLVAIGPFVAEIDVREDGERVRALQAPVLAQPDESAWKGVQVVAVSPTVVETTYRCKRADLVKELSKHVKAGCHLVQVLGMSPDETEAPSGEVRRDSQIMVAVHACP